MFVVQKIQNPHPSSLCTAVDSAFAQVLGIVFCLLLFCLLNSSSGSPFNHLDHLAIIFPLQNILGERAAKVSDTLTFFPEKFQCAVISKMLTIIFLTYV